MRRLIATLLIAFVSGIPTAVMSASTVFISRNDDGVWWYGSRTFFVGNYQWAPNIEPFSVHNAGSTAYLVAEGDYVIDSCNSTTNTCHTSSKIQAWGGLPDGTPVKLLARKSIAISAVSNTSPVVVTTPIAYGLTTGQTVQLTNLTTNRSTIPSQGGTGVSPWSYGNPVQLEKQWTITVLSTTTFSLNGSKENGAYQGGTALVESTLPSNLVDWRKDHYKTYYVKNWGTAGNAADTFSLSATAGGSVMALGSNGSGDWGMTFEGYGQAMAPSAATGAVEYIVDPDTDMFRRADGQPHGLSTWNTVFVGSNGVPPHYQHVKHGAFGTDEPDTTVTDIIHNYQGSRDWPECVVKVDDIQLRLVDPNMDDWEDQSGGCARTVAKYYSRFPGSNLAAPRDKLPMDIVDAGTGSFFFYQKSGTIQITNMTGYPAGTTITWRAAGSIRSGQSTVSGFGNINGSVLQGTYIAKIPAISAPGDYNVTFYTAENSAGTLNPSSKVLPMKAVSIPAVIPKGPATFPPLTTGFNVAANSTRPWQTIEKMMLSNPFNGGGESLGGSGSGGGIWPRCPNRTDPAAPLGFTIPAQDKVGFYAVGWTETVSPVAVRTKRIVHGLGTSKGTTHTNVYLFGGNAGYTENPTTHATAFSRTNPVLPIATTSVTVVDQNTVDITYVNNTFPYVDAFVNDADTEGPEQKLQPAKIDFMGTDQQVWFWNDNDFFRIAQYKPSDGSPADPTWANCGIALADSMIQVYATSGIDGTKIPNIFNFVGTLMGAYGWTGNPKYKRWAIEMGMMTGNLDGSVNDIGIREHSFGMNMIMAKQQLMGINDYFLPNMADALIGMMYIDGKPTSEGTFGEPFMFSWVGPKALAQYYKLTHDARVPYVIKVMMDRMWADGWYHDTFKNIYNLNAPWDGAPSSGTWYGWPMTPTLTNPNPNVGFSCYVSCLAPTGSDLNSYFIPMFAWYWRLTGDETKYYDYNGTLMNAREVADFFVAHIFEYGDMQSGKAWSQQFYSLFDYFDFRLNGGKPVY